MFDLGVQIQSDKLVASSLFDNFVVIADKCVFWCGKCGWWFLFLLSASLGFLQ